MAYEHKPGSFTLFKNDRKESDNHPDYKGEGADIDGNPIWVSAWIKDGKNGKFMSGSIRLKDEARKSATETGHERQQRKAGASQPAPAADFDDDSIPF